MLPSPLNLADGEIEHKVIFHDESSFHANDYKLHFWLKNGEQVLKKKEKGHLIMVSDFVCEETGRLSLSDEQHAQQESLPLEDRLPTNDACVVIFPSSKAGGDDYWNMGQMIEQV